MNDYLEEAKEELKRVDHIIFVSLKYTRTVDIIRNALDRMLSAFDYMIEGILWHNQDVKRIEEIPPSPKKKTELLLKLYPTSKMEHFMIFYNFLRELIKAEYTKREEYRRHVTMTSQLKSQTAEINIDVLEDNFEKIAKDFLEYAEMLCGGIQEG